MVHLVLHPHGIAPTFLKFDSWSPGAGLIPIIFTKGINQIKKGKLQIRHFFFKWVQSRVGAIPRLPEFQINLFASDNRILENIYFFWKIDKSEYYLLIK